MVKCFVSGCRNRTGDYHRRTQKTFFSFPLDPLRVKVWLAALKESDRLGSTKDQLVCEDHFLPRNSSENGVESFPIPIMSPNLDGSMGTISSWEDQPFEEEDQWETGSDESDESEDTDKSGDDDPAPEPSAEDPPFALDPFHNMFPPAWYQEMRKRPEGKNREILSWSPEKKRIKKDKPAVPLAQRLMKILQSRPGIFLNISKLNTTLQSRRRRTSEICRILEEVNLAERRARRRIRWIGEKSSIPPALTLQTEVEALKQVEDTLDRLIRSCSEHFYDVTNDRRNAELAYVTLDDISCLEAFRDQTVVVVKAPDETRVTILTPAQDHIQVHLEGRDGPITVLTCDFSTESRTDSFMSVEESRIKTSQLHREVFNVFESSGDATES